MWFGEWGEGKEGGDGERWPKRRGGGSTLAELVVTLMVASESM